MNRLTERMQVMVLMTLVYVACSAPVVAEAAADEAKPKIAQVFFAQHHVLAPTNPRFKLVGNLDALVKVHVNGRPGSQAPEVHARQTLGSKVLDLPLKGPAQLPNPVAANPLLIAHRYDDSFTAIIPKQWIAPGLKVAAEMRERDAAGKGAVLDRAVFDQLAIGAPTRLVMTMFDIHYFGGDKDGDYPSGWFEQLGARLPLAELELRRVRNILFDTLVQFPREGRPAIRCSSKEEYQQKASIRYDGEQAMALRWNRALRVAAGADGTRRLYYSSIYGVSAGGQAGGLAGVGNGKGQGYLLHELGHALGLPDLWGPALQKYPYVGPMPEYLAPGDKPGVPHVGPAWGFDPVAHAFLPPVWNGGHRRDSMGGGGAGKEGDTGLYRYFSDHHCSRIRDTLERTQVVWDERAQQYLTWDQQAGSYSKPACRKGDPNCPIEDDIEVISVLASVSLVTPEANLVYPAIGPYKAGRIASFDAASPAARAEAREAGYEDAKCNVCLRVTQGGKVTTYLVKDGLTPKDAPTDPRSLAEFAINLPARDGAVTRAELLATPGVMSKG